MSGKFGDEETETAVLCMEKYVYDGQKRNIRQGLEVNSPNDLF